MPEENIALGILRELKKGGRSSGPALSVAAGAPLSAVRQAVAALRKDGYSIEAGNGGYRLVSSPGLSAFELKLLLPGKEVVYADSAASTNSLAVLEGERNGPGLKSGTLFVADMQTNGRGRLGRSWRSPRGVNIYMSYLFRPGIPPRASSLLALAAALAAALAIKARTGLDVKLKWPNDLVANGKKLGGVLIETRMDPDSVVFAVAGIGINVNAEKRRFSGELRDTATSVLIETGKKNSRAALIAGIVREFDHWVRAIRKGLGTDGRAGELIKAYTGLSDTIGKKIRLTTEGHVLEGLATGIDAEGRLMLKTYSDGRTKTLSFSAGDAVTLRRGK